MKVYVLKDPYFDFIYGVFSTTEAAEKDAISRAEYHPSFNQLSVQRVGNLEEQYDFTVRLGCKDQDGYYDYEQTYTIQAFELQ